VKVLKCILVQKVGFLKYKSELLQSHKMKIVYYSLPGTYKISTIAGDSKMFNCIMCHSLEM